MSLLSRFFGDANEKYIKSLSPIVESINALEKEMEAKSDEDLKAMTGTFQTRLKGVAERSEEEEKKALDALLPEAFAVMREASKRVNKMRHFDVQLIGGIILHQGKIAEMKTGEGKTLVATLPLYLNALSGRSAQLITVNDYLSQVGAGWMAPVYDFLGLSTGVIVHDTALKYDPSYSDESQYDERLKHFRPVTRGEAYLCDILYGTNNEFGFDYLRDNMAPSLDRQVQRPLHFAIVDEIDSILIDEARTPLIISAPAADSSDKYAKFAQLVRGLTLDEDYNVDEKMRAATLTEAGMSKMEKLLGVDNIYTSGGIREVHHIEQALKAEALYLRDRDYVVKDGEVIIVDEFTGRLMNGRRYSEGLHQAIEAKEGVTVQRESQTYATVTFQNYFRMYKKLSGMTGTAATEAEEFLKIYNLETVVIPTNKTNIRIDQNDLIYKTEEAKFKAVIEEVKKRHEKGQPVLVGTISIEKNERLSLMMEREGLRPQVLNAKNHLKEAQFIAQAGKSGSITIATNMAGRGVDIILGGSAADPTDQAKVLAAGGLHVIGTERHESRRIDNQLRGRAGRQGDPGSSQFFVSMEDDLMRIFGGERMKNIMTTLNVPDDLPIENKMVSRSIESAQKKVEGNNFDIRKHLVEYDDVINKHRETIYRRRQEILIAHEQAKKEPKEGRSALGQMIMEMVELEIETVVSFHTAAEHIEEWNLEEIYQVASTIFPVEKGLKEDLSTYAKENHKLDRVKVRTLLIEHLMKLAEEHYTRIIGAAKELEFSWLDMEKAILIRSIDTMWVEHLEAMASVRQGIGLRGYGQRDPLIEYKKEAFRLYNELNSYIQKETVYSVFKLGLMHADKKKEGGDMELKVVPQNVSFSAPAKTMEKANATFSGFSNNAPIIEKKPTDAAGNKVGRNDPCPCGSGKKYKKCCGA
jgi:preprotein translocase subunit SecA